VAQEAPGIGPGSKVLIVGCNSQLDAVLANLRATRAEAHVLVADDETAEHMAARVPPQCVHVGQPGSPAFLSEHIASDEVAGVLLLVDPSLGARWHSPSQRAGQVLLRIREIEAEAGRSPVPVVVETTTVTDHSRLQYVNSLFAPSGSERPHLGLVCVQGMCGSLVAQAIGTPRVVEALQDMLNVTMGCDFSIAGVTGDRGRLAFGDVASWAVRTPMSALGIPIAVLRGPNAYLGPPAAFALEPGDRIVGIARISDGDDALTVVPAENSVRN